MENMSVQGFPILIHPRQLISMHLRQFDWVDPKLTGTTTMSVNPVNSAGS